jgi:hypothetical protein
MTCATEKSFRPLILALLLLSCSTGRDQAGLEKELASLDLNRGEITLCTSGTDPFGTVSFSQSCSEKTAADFNLAIALLHSFEYSEAEKVFAKVIDQDHTCVMAYWGVAMANFHALWAAPGPPELEKGSKIISLARTIIDDKTSRESQYLEAIATVYDHWDSLDHRTRVQKYAKAAGDLYETFPDDEEAAIFYALALEAAADPADKTFSNQKKAGEILNKFFQTKPDHPGVAHYLIHNYDYPELASLGLPAARKYASIAAGSAHALHMPSHIFTRLGLWDESIQSNINSMAAAQCYAQASGMAGHWDEELHAIDYLTYAYLQKANDQKALEQLQYLQTIKEVFPVNFKDAYCFSSVPARYALERRDWQMASSLELWPADFPWDKFEWEKANLTFARLIAAVYLKKNDKARSELEVLKSAHSKLTEANEKYKANLVLIQLKAGEGCIRFADGDKNGALNLLAEAAEMEEATAKHPVTPGEIIPCRELLADVLMEMGDPQRALKEYEADLKTHPNRFNGLYGAALAAEKSGDVNKARQYYEQLLTVTEGLGVTRPQLARAKSYLAKKV